MSAYWAYRVGALILVVTLTAPTHGQMSDKIVVDGSTGVMPLVAALAKAHQERHPGVVVEIGKGLGTKARLQALMEGKIDVALASHGLVAEALGRQGLAVHEIAKVAVVFSVNASVSTANLTDRQICDLYRGTITNWKELGGPDLAIAPRTRPDSEVDAEVVRAKIACLKDLKMPDGVRVMPRSGDMARELAATVGAIGMTTTTVVEQSRGRIRLLALNGVVPSRENVERKIYTLTRDSFLVTKAPPPPAVSRFIDFIRSPAGSAVIVANGAVPAK
ncbi:MAG: phosphate ABC transporter substrate-binding protein [Candidatus Rokubacteria bacterium]|nr:phosphate ABC transporter substrate-binding protein [Candidatus Rokubacteria bacterium]